MGWDVAQGGDVAQLVEHRTDTSPTQVRFPGATIFFFFLIPESAFSADSLTVFLHPCVQLHAFTSLRTLRARSPCQSSVDYGNTKTASMHRRRQPEYLAFQDFQFSGVAPILYNIALFASLT